MKTLFIIRGIVGSGKSTFAKTLNCPHFEADQYFIDKETGEYKFDGSKIKDAHAWCQKQVEDAMKFNEETYGLENSEIAVSNTFTQEWEMAPYYELANMYNYMVFSIIVENRHGGKNIHGVPDDKIEMMRKRFEVKL
jgi:predicted kinase